MEDGWVLNTMQATSVHRAKVSEVLNRGIEAVAESWTSTTKVDGVDHKERPHNWEESPERTSSLLPAFGATRPSHLPTPQSPGNLTGYLSGLAQSPSSTESSLPGHVRYLSTLRTPSRPTSVHPPQTPPRGKPPSACKAQSSFGAQRDPGCDLHGHIEEIDSRLQPSQIATPSPEVFRINRASIPNSPSEYVTYTVGTPGTRRFHARAPFSSETMLATPQVKRPSSSYTYVGPTSLAPAPIISPANSSHSTIYHASPELGTEVLHPNRTYNFSNDMIGLVSEHNMQAVQEYYDPDDPFIVRQNEDHGGPLTSHRYPSPPTKRHRSSHSNISPSPCGKGRKKGQLENSMAKLVMSPSESSDIPSHGSPVEAAVDDRGDNKSMESRVPTLDRSTSCRDPTSSLTLSPPIVSATPPEFESHTSVPEQAPLLSTGGEIERIRQRDAMREEIRTAESEKRRPEYMMRIKRTRDTGDDEAVEKERDSTLPGLGISISPSRGRRLKLYQPVAVASDVVLGHHDVETDDIPDPRTPPPLSTMYGASQHPWRAMMPSMSLRAIDWRTPRRSRSSPVAWSDEDELKKQKRLQAFSAPEASGKNNRLKPVEIVGHGRVVIDITSEESQRLAAAGVLHLLETPGKDSMDDPKLPAASSHGAEWPDNEYPWSEQEQQRDEYAEAEKRRRLAWIQRFLDRESESEDEDNEGVAGPSSSNELFDVDPTAQLTRGRGKPISLKTVPNAKHSRSGRRIAFGAANADAREVLLSKKHVRVVAERVRKKRIAEEEEGVVMCICQGADDGRPMVRCDECRTWYHLVCMDIHDESELGDEWYCWKCLPSAEDPPPAPSSEPTFAPAMPESPPRVGAGDQPLYQSSLQPSPMPASPVARRKRDSSPIRRSRLPHLVGDPGDPVRGGPSTPYHSRATDSKLYFTPKLYEEYCIDDQAPFDPTSTPSRGLKFPNSVPITPRRPHTWAPAQPQLWTTPSGPPRTPQFSSLGASSSIRSLSYSLSTLEDSVGPLTSPWPADESPTRRPHKWGDSVWPYSTPRRVLDSPLAVGSADHRHFLQDGEDSPTPRRSLKGMDGDISDFTSRAGQGRSPHRD